MPHHEDDDLDPRAVEEQRQQKIARARDRDEKILSRHLSGHPSKVIAEDLGLSTSYVNQIIREQWRIREREMNEAKGVTNALD